MEKLEKPPLTALMVSIPQRVKNLQKENKGTLLAVCWASLGKNLHSAMTYNFCCRCIGKCAKSA
jgi:hypothetical protein